MQNQKAFLFDLNGTMIDDMTYHINAWHQILNGLGAGISLEKAQQECYGKNEELLERIFPGRFSMDEKKKLSEKKEKKYRQDFKPHLKLIEGLNSFLDAAKQSGISMAIGTAAISSNVNYVIDHLNLHTYFDTVICADDVKKSKPHPETFLRCAELLGVEQQNCLVFEDSPKGVESACNAGMQAVVITTTHTAEEFSAFPNIIGFIKNYQDKLINDMLPLNE
jgi:beta-phosphoglucomutase family hydrolase